VNLLDRILLVLLSLLGIVSAGLMMIAIWGLDANLYQIWNSWHLTVVVLAVFLLAISIRFLFYRRNGHGRDDSADSVLLEGLNGQIRISHETIRQLANRTGQSIRGVYDFETRIRTGDGGILLSTRVRVHPDVQLAELSANIQQAVKDYVEHMTGVVVERLVVNIVEVVGATTSTRPANRATKAD